jgi:hypothetical protein
MLQLPSTLAVLPDTHTICQQLVVRNQAHLTHLLLLLLLLPPVCTREPAQPG